MELVSEVYRHDPGLQWRNSDRPYLAWTHWSKFFVRTIHPIHWQLWRLESLTASVVNSAIVVNVLIGSLKFCLILKTIWGRTSIYSMSCEAETWAIAVISVSGAAQTSRWSGRLAIVGGVAKTVCCRLSQSLCRLYFRWWQQFESSLLVAGGQASLD